MTANKKLIYIHGRDFKPPAEQVSAYSFGLLRHGLERDYPQVAEKFDNVQCVLAYYGDLTNALLTDSGAEYDAEMDLADRNNACLALKQLDKRKRFSGRRYDQLPGKSALKELIADIGAPVLGSVGLKSAVIARVAPELDTYWSADDFRAALRERVLSVLQDALDDGSRVMIIAHGVGSVVAYDVLWLLSRDAVFRDSYATKKIDVFVTLGSPLGDEHVKRRLLGSDASGADKYPNNVVNWFNVSAEDDYTCHDKTLADDFKRMLKHRVVSRIRDYRIFNLAVRFGKSAPHSSLGYLAHPRLAQLLSDWICSDDGL